MSTPNDGGPALPVGCIARFDGQRWTTLTPDDAGLRDYFAAKALQGMLADTNCDMRPEHYAAYAYELADAMLAARKENT